MIRLLAHAAVCLALGTGLAAVDSAYPAQAKRPTHMQACKAEDGPGPCVWDAKHRGNGKGKSFTLKGNGQTVYVNHGRAHRLTHKAGR